MAEENQVVQNSEGQVEQSAQEGKASDETGKNTEEVKRLELTQDELDEIIAKRVARERKKFADYDEKSKRLAELEKEAEERRLAEMSEKERAEELAKKFEEEKQTLAKQLEELHEANKQKDIRNEFYRFAQKEGIEYIDDAFRLADLSTVEYGEDGVKGVEEVVKALVEGKPFLLKRETQEPKQIGAPSNPVKASAAKTKEQLLEEARKKARSGRPEDMAEYSRLKRELGV